MGVPSLANIMPLIGLTLNTFGLIVEIAIVAMESGLAEDRVRPLVMLARKLRGLKGQDLEEGLSTRLLVYCAILIRDGMSVDTAIRVAMIEPLSDDPDVKSGLGDLVVAVMG